MNEEEFIEKFKEEKIRTMVKNNNNSAITFIIAVLFFGGIGWFGFTLISGNDDTSTLTQNYIADKTPSAYIQSQNFIKQSLKAPSTAKFPLLDYVALHIGNNTFTVLSHVDSQNGFGAMIRSYWTVRLKYLGGEDYAQLRDISNWQLIEMIIDDEVIYP